MKQNSHDQGHPITGMIGLGEIKITPPIGTDLSGYSAWKRLSTGVHDDIHVRCVVIEAEGTAIALLSIPVCTLDTETTLAIRKGVNAQTGIPEQNILVHATHTHSAPYVKDDYQIFLQDQSVRCAAEAWKTRFAANIGAGLTTVNECGRNRRYLDYGGLPVDPDIGVIKIEDKRGQLRAVVFNYACHGTCLDARNTLVTEDWPFFAGQAIKQATGNNVTVVYLGGPAGDINPGYSAGLSAVAADIPIRTWSEARRIGERVGNAVIQAMPSIHTAGDIRLKTKSAFVDLPLRQSYPLTLAEAGQKTKEAESELAKLEQAPRPVKTCLERAKVKVFFAGLMLKGAQNFYAGKWKGTVRAELQTIVINDSVLTTFPGEVFVTAGLEVKRQSPAQKTMVIGLANACEARGYMPTHEAYAEGDYEVFDTYYNDNAADILVEASVNNIRSLWSDAQATGQEEK